MIIGPCRNDIQLRDYIHLHWRRNHVLTDPQMFNFQYRTPWVPYSSFPSGTSVMCAYLETGELAGFLGAIVEPRRGGLWFWLSLWHVLDEHRGTGLGGRLLDAMMAVAMRDGEWIGTFGAGPAAVPVYLRRGFTARMAFRWVREPYGDGRPDYDFDMPTIAHSEREGKTREWLDYRYGQHPTFTYERDAGLNVIRKDGQVCHVLEHAGEVECGLADVVDCWAFTSPGHGWRRSRPDEPDVFHPVECRGGTHMVVGYPFMPMSICKGDCDQDRPNVLRGAECRI